MEPTPIGHPPSDVDSPSEGFVFRQRENEQASLFPVEDVVIPDSIAQFRKPIAAIHAVPLRAEHAQTLNGRRLFDACVLTVQIEFKRRGGDYLRRVLDDRVSPLFDVRVNDMVRLAQIPGKNYERVYAELDVLYETTFAWNVIGEDGSVQWRMKSHFLSSLGFGDGVKKGLIRFSIDPSILQIILEPSVWATLSLKPMEGLRTAPSYALYQQCWRYIGTQHKVTPDWPVETWVDLLIGPSRYVTEVKGVGRRVTNYGDFKRRVLLDSMARVNEVAALNYTLEIKEGYSGRRVSRLQFRMVPKKQTTLGLPLIWPRVVLDVLQAMGFTDSDIEDIGQIYAYEVVAESLTQLKNADERLRMQGRRITSKKAYFKGILANIQSGATALDLDGIEAEARQQEAKNKAQERRKRLEEGFADHVAHAFAQRLFALEDPVRQALLHDFASSPSGAMAKPFLERGWSQSNKGLLSLLRTWMRTERSDLLAALLPNDEDQTIEGYITWKADQNAEGVANPI